MKYGYEGWHEDVLLLVGEEISPKRNHYLAFGIKREVKGEQWRGDIQPLIDFVKKDGGIGIIAHPHGKNPVRGCDHSWINWKYKGYDGLEIWSYMLDWVSDVSYFSALYYYLHPEKAVNGPNPDTLRKWDEIAMKRHVVGIGSIDAHGREMPIFRFIKFLPYEYLFQTIRTHILVPSPFFQFEKSRVFRRYEQDVRHPRPPAVRWRAGTERHKSKKLVYDAISSGHCFIGYDLIADSSGFRFTAIVDDEDEVLMGDELEMEKSAFLQIKTPLSAEIRLIRNGELIKTHKGNSMFYKTDEVGVYRVEVYLDDLPWVFSNPIFLRYPRQIETARWQDG